MLGQFQYKKITLRLNLLLLLHHTSEFYMIVAAYAAPILLFPDVPWAFPVMVYFCINWETLAAHICIYKTLPHLMKKISRWRLLTVVNFTRARPLKYVFQDEE